MKHSYEFDVLIAGAGPAGAIMARNLSSGGLRVGLFDPIEDERLYKPIVVEVEPGIFAKTGVPMPGKGDIPYHPSRMRAISTLGKTAFTIDGRKLPLAIFQDRVVSGILKEAVSSGASIFRGYKASGLLFDGLKTTGARFETADGRIHEVKARLTVDATGYSAALVRSMPAHMGFDFPSGGSHEVIAECRLHMADRGLAEQAIGQGIHGDDEVWCRFGQFGSYSTVFSYLSARKEIAYILIGFKNGYYPIDSAISEYRRSQGYFREEIHGARGPIRIRHSLDRLVSDGFMAVGEAACMVFPVNGSGVSSALHAGTIASKSVIDALGSGEATTAALWPYAAGYQRTRGRSFAAYDVSRLVVDSLGAAKVGILLESGLLGPDEMGAAANPAPPGVKLGAVPGKLRGLAKNPSLIKPIAGMGARIGLVLMHYSRYPERYDEETFGRWSAASRKLFAPLYVD